MSCIEKFSDEVISEMVGNDLDWIDVILRKPINSQRNQDEFYFQVIGHKHELHFEITEQSGKVEGCNCGECEHWRNNWCQYYSIFKAIQFITANHSDIEIYLYVDSEAFLSDSLDGFYSPERFNCEKANSFLTELFALLWAVDNSGFYDLIVERDESI